MKNLPIEIATEAEAEFLPVYSSELAAGADVKARLKEKILLEPGASVLVPTGLRLAIPQGFEIQVRPRSGLALNHQITVLNSPGTIDADYRGEIRVILINHGEAPFVIRRGERIAQMVIAPVVQAALVPAVSLTETGRGAGGFGSTGR